jgi:ATP-binding cassette subfamily B protein
LSKGWRLVWAVARRRRLTLVVGLSALLAVDLLQLVVPRVIKHAVDELTTGRALAADMLTYAAIALALALGMAGLRMLWRPLIFGYSRMVERDLRQYIFDHIQSLHLGYLDDNPPGQLMARATNDLINVRMAVGMGMVAALDGIALATAAMGFMLYISPSLTLLAVLPMPAIVIITRVISRRLHRQFDRVQESFSNLTELAREALSGIRTVKAFATTSREIGRLEVSGREYVDLNVRLAKYLAFFFPITIMFTNLSLATILGLGGPFTVLGRITTGDFVAFTAYLGLLTWPMMALGWVVNLMQQARASMERIDQVLDTDPAITDPEQPANLPAGRLLDIEAKDLTFRYPGQETPALDRVSLSVPAGGTVALVGRIGCGKTTLLKLLARLYEPPSGTLLVGGVDVNLLAQAELRAKVVQVPQEALLFSDTVRANLVLGRPQAGEDEIWRALTAAHLDQEIRELPEGLDSRLGEGGKTLSGGQRQRLALARALILNPPVLVLDDPLSAVDTETEAAILNSLAALRHERTTLLVSHRLASIAFASRIYLLEKGRVIESGSHQELIQAGGGYQKLFAEQALLAQVERE